MAATATRPKRPPVLTPSNGDLSDAWVSLPPTAYTLDGFRAWTQTGEYPERLRAAFIDGEIYLDMSQEEIFTHVDVKTEVTHVLVGLNQEIDLGRFFGDGTQIANKQANLVSQADGSLATWETIEAELVRFIPRKGKAGQCIELEGTVDWIMEIVSDSSVGKDYRRLRLAYHRARIQEYWLIDARGDEIFFQILLWRRTGYVAAPSRDGWQRSRVFGRSFRLTRRRGRQGLWQYTLEIRPT